MPSGAFNHRGHREYRERTEKSFCFTKSKREKGISGKEIEVKKQRLVKSTSSALSVVKKRHFLLYPGEKYHINVPVSRIKKLLRLACGYALVVLGIIGLFLPVLQGTLMILAGAALLGWDLSFLKRWRNRLASWWRNRWSH